MKRLKNEQGASLVLVLLVLVVFTVLGITILGLGLGNVKMTVNEREDQSTFYIAEAGLAQAENDISKEISSWGEMGEAAFLNKAKDYLLNYGKIAEDFDTQFGERPKTIVQVEEKAPNQYAIVSQGVIGSKSKTVKRDLNITWNGGGGDGPGGGIELPTDLAVLVKETIKLDGGAKIHGKVGTNALENDPAFGGKTIEITGGAGINGTINYQTGFHFELPQFPEFPSYASLPNKMITHGSGNTYEVIKNGDLRIDNYIANHFVLKMTENISFKKITLKENNNLTIDLGDKDREMVVDHLNIENGHINIIGSGNLTIFVKDKITMGAGSSINKNGSIERLQVYYKGNQVIQLGGDQKIYGSLFAEKANIDITAGSGFQGYIFTGGTSVKLSGGSSGNPGYIYAPNATVYFQGGGTVKGTVVGNRYVGDGGTSVTYQKFDLENPFNKGSQPIPNVGSGSIETSPSKGE